jgi:hypothetical protein
MDPITIGMALAQFAPSLIKIFTGSDKAADVAGKVVDIAKTAGQQVVQHTRHLRGPVVLSCHFTLTINMTERT